MNKQKTPQKQQPARNLTGIAVPLGALATDKGAPVGEFRDLIKLADFCRLAKIKIIQLLPVNDTGTQSSPYNGLSAFALNPLYISIPDIPCFSGMCMAEHGLSMQYDLFLEKHKNEKRYHYNEILKEKNELLRAVFTLSNRGKDSADELSAWIKKNEWVTGYAVFKHLKYKYKQSSWKNWQDKDKYIDDKEIKKRWDDASLIEDHLFYAWEQFVAHKQFLKAADYIRQNGIILKGDMPIMMNEDSCDAWLKPDIFDHTLRAGSPPDGENKNGQTWGFPIYRWDVMKKNGYKWWKDRLACAAQYYRAYRLDHILGFFRIWAVPEEDTTAYLGHTEPKSVITKDMLYEAGFDDGRIKWLSEPHIPTGAIEDITWNHESACSIISLVSDRIGSEELWNFKKTIAGDRFIDNMTLDGLCTKEAADRIKAVLHTYWKDRCLVKIKRGGFTPVWSYKDSTAWKSLSNGEKEALKNLFAKIDKKQNNLWKKHAEELLSELTGSVDMIPCGEDLGVNLPCAHDVLKDNGILGLRVVRWCRDWGAEGQPFIDFSDYDRLSVTTTSVHDSATLRQWWKKESESALLFKKTFKHCFDDAEESECGEFTPEYAQSVMRASAFSNSVWCIHPMQDFLFMQKKYWRDDEKEERINVPGSVNEFNWTYRLPAKLETLMADETLIQKIRDIVKKHENRGEQ